MDISIECWDLRHPFLIPREISYTDRSFYITKAVRGSFSNNEAQDSGRAFRETREGRLHDHLPLGRRRTWEVTARREEAGLTPSRNEVAAIPIPMDAGKHWLVHWSYIVVRHGYLRHVPVLAEHAWRCAGVGAAGGREEEEKEKRRQAGSHEAQASGLRDPTIPWPRRLGRLRQRPASPSVLRRVPIPHRSRGGAFCRGLCRRHVVWYAAANSVTTDGRTEEWQPTHKAQNWIVRAFALLSFNANSRNKLGRASATWCFS
jgi:hypothetical protein